MFARVELRAVEASQAATFGATSLYTSTITRDNLGRVSTNTEKIGGVTTKYTYTYNNVGRLTAVKKGTVPYSTYVYDANGNRTSRTISGVAVTATTDAQDRLLTQGTLSFTYNQNGEMLTKTDSATSATTGYVWDTIGNLKRVNLPGGVNYVEYLLDGFNRRHARKVNGVIDRYFVYQNQLQIAAELTSTGALIARYVYGSRQNVPEYMVKSGVNYRIISDQLGSVRLVVRALDGVIVQRMDYDEFGRVTNDTSPGFQAFGFAGGLYDGASKLTHFGARDYDAETGRWLSKDPILFGGGDTNLYGYVMSDPANFFDPNGLWGLQIGVSAGGIFPTLGAGAEAGVAITYSANAGLEVGGYTSGHVKAGAGIFGGFGVNVSLTPSAQSVSHLGGASAGFAIDAPFAGASIQFSDQGGRASPTYGLGLGPGGLGAAYGTLGYTGTSSWFSSRSNNMCGAN